MPSIPPRKNKRKVSLVEYYDLLSRNRVLENQLHALEAEKQNWKDWMLDKPEPPEQGQTPRRIETSMQEVHRRVCSGNGHQIALAMDELVTKTATYADAPAKEIARERTWMCLRCGMSLAEIRGET